MAASYNCCFYFCSNANKGANNYANHTDRPDRISLRGIAPKPTETPKKLLKSLSSTNFETWRQKHQQQAQSQSRIAREINSSRQCKIDQEMRRISRVSSQLDMHMSRIWKMREQLDVIKRT